MARPDMIIEITRDAYQSDHKVTVGRIRVIEGNKTLFECASLELPWKNNARGKSSIPVGEYIAKWTYSPSFRRYLWELIDVPGRKYIRLHVANYTRQLRGCIAPGMRHADIDMDGTLDIASSAKALRGIHEYTNNYIDTEVRFVVKANTQFA